MINKIHPYILYKSIMTHILYNFNCIYYNMDIMEHLANPHMLVPSIQYNLYIFAHSYLLNFLTQNDSILYPLSETHILLYYAIGSHFSIGEYLVCILIRIMIYILHLSVYYFRPIMRLLPIKN